jgi:hypothetical protein
MLEKEECCVDLWLYACAWCKSFDLIVAEKACINLNKWNGATCKTDLGDFYSRYHLLHVFAFHNKSESYASCHSRVFVEIIHGSHHF